jgi:hypothetical protein
LLRRPLRRGRIAIQYSDFATLGSEAARDRATNAATAAGHCRHLVLKSLHLKSPCMFRADNVLLREPRYRSLRLNESTIPLPEPT